MQRCSQGRWVKPCIQSKGLLDHFFVKPLRRHRIHDDVPAVPVDRGGGGDEGGLVQQGIAMALLALALAVGAGYQPVWVGRVSAMSMANRVPLD